MVSDKLVTINGLKRVISKLNKDVSLLKGNPMMKVSDVVSAFEESLEREDD